jgi:hypothetical protein
MKPTKPSSACGPETNATGGCGSSVDRMPAPNGGLPPAGGGVGHGRDTLALQRRSPAKVGGRASETTTNQKHQQRLVRAFAHRREKGARKSTNRMNSATHDLQRPSPEVTTCCTSGGSSPPKSALVACDAPFGAGARENVFVGLPGHRAAPANLAVGSKESSTTAISHRHP